jgi:CheY-like chemotaxis protein
VAGGRRRGRKNRRISTAAAPSTRRQRVTRTGPSSRQWSRSSPRASLTDIRGDEPGSGELRRHPGSRDCHRIRAQAWGRSVVLVAVTGWGQEEDRRRSHEAGFDRHLVKPVDPHDLMKMVADLHPAKG